MRYFVGEYLKNVVFEFLVGNRLLLKVAENRIEGNVDSDFRNSLFVYDFAPSEIRIRWWKLTLFDILFVERGVVGIKEDVVESWKVFCRFLGKPFSHVVNH